MPSQTQGGRGTTTVPTEAQARRMQDFLNEMAKVLGRPVRVDLDLGAAGTGEYAFTDGKKGHVVIDPWKLDSWGQPVRAWLQTKGLFYHEMMHCVADPVENYNIPAIKPVARTVNALSDQTGEVRFVNMYPGARGYFAMNVFEIILKGKVNERTYALVYGRRGFLPARLVAAARKLMRKQYSEADVVEIERLIDEYHAQTTKGAPLQVFADIAKKVQDILHKNLEGMEEQIATGRMTQEAQRKDDNTPAEPQPGEPGEAQEGEGESGEGESKDEAEPGEEGEGKGKPKPESEADDATEGSGAGSGEEERDSSGKKDAPREPTQGELEDEVEAIAKEELEGESDDALRTAEREVSELQLGATLAETTAQASVALAALLKRIQLKVTAGYEEGHKSGRLDLRRVRQGQARPVRTTSLDVFKAWQPDRQQETKLSVALVIDNSGSMGGGKLDDVNQAAAAVALACERSNPALNRVMIRYFSDGDRMTKRPQDAFDPSTSLSAELGGGTRPNRSIREALDWLRGEQGVRVAFILTDGEWSDSEFEQKQLADRARRTHIEAHVLYLNIRGPKQAFPTQTVAMSELAEKVFAIVNAAMKAQIRRVMA